MPQDITVRYYTKWRAIFGNHQVFHVHWPDHLLRDTSRIKTWAKRVVFAAILLRCSFTRTSVVRTAHNAVPHERSRSIVERGLLSWLDSISHAWIVMNKQTPLRAGAKAVVIPHGHYRDWYDNQNVHQVPGRILSFGIVRPYKNIPVLVRSMRLMENPTASLHVLGDCSDQQLAAEIREAAGSDERIRLSLTHAGDEELARAIGESTLVALPYTQLLNSGALLLALSLNRPALVPDTPATREYRAEFGDRWILTYSGELNAEVLANALAVTKSQTTEECIDLSSREWPEISRATAAVYRNTTSATAALKADNTQGVAG